VVGLARYHQLLPGDALDAGDRADRDALFLQDRALLDVDLDVGVGGGAGDRRVARPADPLQLVAQDGAVDGDDVQRVLQGHAAHVDQAAQHVGGETAALLVGEEGDGDRAPRADTRVIEGADHLQPGEDAQGAVVAAAGADRVDVAAGHHRRQRRVQPGAGGDHVADPVDADRQPQVPHPAHHQLAAAGVLVGQRQPAVAAVARVAHLGQGHQVGQQALDLDLHPGSPPTTGGSADQGKSIHRSVSRQV
jgi:hypothetical protein